MRPSFLAFDLGASHVVGGVFCFRRGAVRLEAVASESWPVQPCSASAWLQRLTPALAKIVADQGWRGRCGITLPGEFTLTKSIVLPAGINAARWAGEKHDPGIEQIAAEYIPLPLDSVAWSLGAIAGGVESEALLAVAKLALIRPLLEALSRLGLEVERIVPAPVAFHDGFCQLFPEREPSVVLADLDANCGNVVVLSGGRRVFRSVHVGGSGADGVGSENWNAVVAADFVRAIPTWRGPAGEIALDRIYFSGRTGRDDLEAKIAQRLKVPLTRCELRPPIECGPAPLRVMAEIGESGGWLRLFGLVGPKGAGSAAGIDLLPPADVGRLETRRRRQTLAGGVAVLAFALMPAVAYYYHCAQTAVAAVSALEKEVGAKQREQATRDRLRSEVETVGERVAVLERATMANPAWLDLFARLQEQTIVTDHVWLDRFVVERQRAGPKRAVGAKAASAVRDRDSGPRPQMTDATRTAIHLSGRILDAKAMPGAPVTAGAYAQARELLTRLRSLPSIADLESERFEAAAGGLLRFEATLVLHPSSLL